MDVSEPTHSDYRAEVPYAAPPERVFDALATPAGTAGWWSTSGDPIREPGELVRLDWSATDHVTFRIEELERPRRMRWRCVAQSDSNLPEPDEWVGTTLEFELTPAGEGTSLTLVHHGLHPELECYETCDRGWEFFLRRSVRALVETGRGLPYESEV